jgi:hypothetical protein
VTFNSQPHDDGPFPQFHPRTPSGDRRLRRVCRRTSLAVVNTAQGPVGVGIVGKEGLDVLTRNLRCYHPQPGGGPWSPATVETFWALIGDTSTTEPSGRLVADLWEASLLLEGEPPLSAAEATFRMNDEATAKCTVLLGQKERT